MRIRPTAEELWRSTTENSHHIKHTRYGIRKQYVPRKPRILAILGRKWRNKSFWSGEKHKLAGSHAADQMLPLTWRRGRTGKHTAGRGGWASAPLIPLVAAWWRCVQGNEAPSCSLAGTASGNTEMRLPGLKEDWDFLLNYNNNTKLNIYIAHFKQSAVQVHYNNVLNILHNSKGDNMQCATVILSALWPLWPLLGVHTLQQWSWGSCSWQQWRKWPQ